MSALVALAPAGAVAAVPATAVSVPAVGRMAKRFGGGPEPLAGRMLPFTLFRRVQLWFILSRRGGPGGGRWA